MCSVGGQCKVQTADYCFQHANEYVTIIVPLFSNPKNNSPQSGCSLQSAFYTAPFICGRKLSLDERLLGINSFF